MAKRRIRAAELAGLAALGAFGHSLFGSGRDRKPAERFAEAPSTPAQNAPAPYRDVDETGLGGFGSMGLSGPYAETGGMGRSEVSAADQGVKPPPVVAAPVALPAAPVPAQVATRSFAPAARNARVSTARLLSTDEDFVPSRMAQAPVIGPRSQGIGGPTAADIATYRRQQQQEAMRGRGFGRVDVDPRSRPVVPRSRPMTREELINQISIGGDGTVAGGQRVAGNETTRNLANIAAGLGPTRLAGFGNAAIEGATARGALQRAAALRAERTEAARRGQTPTNFTSTGSKSTSRANEASKRTRKFDEEEANVEFKRGGKTNAKPQKMASGGMSSASKRGDGIATKGKTKCKMY